MADISKLEQQANLLFNNVAGWEQFTLQRIGKRIGKYGKMSLADVKAINNIVVVKQDMDAITKELAKVTGYNISQIEQMYGELLEEQHLANQPLYDYRGKKFVPFKDNRELQAIARAYAKTTGETMINLAKTKALGFVDGAGKFNNMQSTLVNVLDRAVMSVSTGAEDFNTVVRDAIKELGGSGLRVDYGTAIINGKEVRITRNLASVVRQDVLWGAKQASKEYNEMIGKELGTDGEEVDFHFPCRPSHEFMQGKQYCTSGTQTINGEKFIGFSDPDPSSPDGLSAERALQDYGCNHYTIPIICGISEPRYDAKELADLKTKAETPIEIDGVSKKPYEWQQSMRSLENAIRQQKWEKAIATGASKNEIVKGCNAKIKAYREKYNQISEKSGIAVDTKRLSIQKPKI